MRFLYWCAIIAMLTLTKVANGNPLKPPGSKLMSSELQAHALRSHQLAANIRIRRQLGGIPAPPDVPMPMPPGI